VRVPAKLAPQCCNCRLVLTTKDAWAHLLLVAWPSRACPNHIRPCVTLNFRRNSIQLGDQHRSFLVQLLNAENADVEVAACEHLNVPGAHQGGRTLARSRLNIQGFISKRIILGFSIIIAKKKVRAVINRDAKGKQSKCSQGVTVIHRGRLDHPPTPDGAAGPPSRT
jgi:hypothetical protein